MRNSFYQHFTSLSFILCFFIILSTSYSISAQIYLKMSYETDMTFEEIVDSTERYYDKFGRDKGLGYRPFKRWEYESERSLDANGRVRSYAQDLEEYRKFVKKHPEQSQKSVSVEYTELGPTSAVNTVTWSSALGRFSAVGLDINNPNHVIAGSPTGGIWRTEDGGQSWDACYDYTMNMNINALEISHADATRYIAGTSNEIIYSEDSGRSWERSTTGPIGQQVNTIIMDPVDENILLATDRYANRVWRSTDGGVNWSVVYNAPDDTYDIEFKPGDSNIVYVSGRGFISKSTDNGLSWSPLSGPWGSGVIMMAVTDSEANIVYALQETSGGYNATFRSTDEGMNWTTQSDNSSGSNNILTYNQNNAGGQAPRDMDIVVSPYNAAEVYVAGTELWKSDDSGVTFTKVADWLVSSGLPFIHADVDLLYYNKNAFYAGTDGGLFVSTDNASSWTDWTSGTGVRQFYRIGVSATDVDRVSGGSQDNGTGTLVGGTWYDWVGADGMETFIDWSDEDIIYTNIQYGGLYKSIDGGQNRVPISNTPGGNGAWVTPTEQDPMNSNTLYQAKKEVYKSTNGGLTWSAISAIAHGGNANELEIAPSDNQYIYVSWGSTLYRTTDGGSNWSDISPGTGTINYIDVHPTDPDRVVVAVAGEIHESTNGGANWNEITYNLPNITYHCAIYANDGSMGIYAGGRPGVYYLNNSTSNKWLNVSGNLPTVQVRELEIKHNFLYVATYGRGLWKSSIQSIEGMNCNEAIVLIAPGTYTSQGPSYGNGCHNCSSSSHANWYTFTPPKDGVVNIYSCRGGADTRLFVYEGANCGSLTEIASGDDDCEISFGGATHAAEVSMVNVSAGVPIFIEWDDRWSQSSFLWTLEFCDGDLFGADALDGVQSNSEVFETNGDIESTQQITGNGTNVIYDSRFNVFLNAGFEVNVGAIFEAYIDGCNGLK